MPTIHSVLIANRGEIACRIIRTCRRLGIRAIAVYSDVDAKARHVRLADQAIHIGGSRPAESYLRIETILAAARQSGAQAIHPGYGFLSENADFVEAVEAAGLIFIGPSAASMRQLGSKAGAKELMQTHGVPVVPGYTGEDQAPALLRQQAELIGFPLMIKAAHGGGGKGMRVVRSLSEFDESLSSCQREAAGAFGRDRVLLERYIEQPRHIEFQIFGDAHGKIIHLNERECSAQRRYQKVLEESPSVALDEALREAMGAAAVAAGKAVGYRNAGTVEFILGADRQFYFMEINQRLQVEHPVTECVTGFDLVEWQLRVAAGEALPVAQSEVKSRGHAIELRLYAEDADRGFLPGSGVLHRLSLPADGDGVRVDAGVEQGDLVSLFYDPMIAKLIVHAADRPQALRLAADALALCDVEGPASNIGFLERLIAHPSVTEGRIDTGYLDRHLDQFTEQPERPPAAVLAAACALHLATEREDSLSLSRQGEDRHSPWALADGWRIGQPGQQPISLQWRGHTLDFVIEGHADAFLLHLDQTLKVEVVRREHGSISLRLGESSDAEVLRLAARQPGHDFLIHHQAQRYKFHPARPFEFEGSQDSGANTVRAPMPGRIVAIQCQTNDQVSAQQVLLVMEAMKMELSLRAPRDGTVAEIRGAVGDIVEADAVLIAFEEG
ncbi:acetyl/propionyl/methylcrotonyl-CoA carboxylase subunit alpha [Pseudomarimonas arenosa]|uniref:Biotin carboxylase n=1 Tax=Pseudomarimonas arenosa TaxID=2774145 RepID=A0AAW3ZHB0_9GAMM|nr:biotin carboxylase N-terminal domain-containing protein [Pseudomarimonas arenosa]MBD8524502.1 ATP-grasp domain-containing protein [Pseudomarimonas arenosa]